MVESEWNMALDTLYRLSQGIHRCNDAMHAGDFREWLKGLYHFYGELSTWMNAEDQNNVMTQLGRCKQYRTHDFDDNLTHFFLTTQILRREAHKHKLLLKEGEDTMKHGG
ncbi:MAG: hypothetical protein LC650_05080 [Actinobacteria bacterium]|nr:hypothetical protein [Actinomycetota bacterium]